MCACIYIYIYIQVRFAVHRLLFSNVGYWRAGVYSLIVGVGLFCCQAHRGCWLFLRVWVLIGIAMGGRPAMGGKYNIYIYIYISRCC